MAKKRRTRKQKKQQKQARKGKILQRQKQSDAILLPPIELDPVDMETIAPLMAGSDAQSMKNMTAALNDSGRWSEESELIEILFPPEMSLGMFIKAAEEIGYTSESFFALKGAAFEDAFFDITSAILPALLTEEIRQEILEGLTALSQRYKKRFQRRKAAQVTFVKLILTDEGQKPIWPQIGLLQAIASRSIDAGFKLVDAIEEIGQSDETFFDEDGNFIESAAISRLTKSLEKIPGIDRILGQQIDQLWEDAESAVYDGTLHLDLYTEDELERADAILAKYLEPVQAVGQEGIPDEIVPAMLQELDDYLIRLLTPERLAQMQQRLSDIIRQKQVETKWLGVIKMLRDGLGEADAVAVERPFLFRALMGELQTAVRQEEEE